MWHKLAARNTRNRKYPAHTHPSLSYWKGLQEQWIRRLLTLNPQSDMETGSILPCIDAAVQCLASVQKCTAEVGWRWGEGGVVRSLKHHHTAEQWPKFYTWQLCKLVSNLRFMSKILIWPCQLFTGNMNKIKSKWPFSYFTDSGVLYTLWQELVGGFTALHKYLYLKSAEFLFGHESWPRFKEESSPCSCSSLSLMTAGLQLIFYMFDLHTEDKPKMTAAVDKELQLVKGRQYNQMTWDPISQRDMKKKKQLHTELRPCGAGQRFSLFSTPRTKMSWSSRRHRHHRRLQ